MIVTWSNIGHIPTWMTLMRLTVPLISQFSNVFVNRAKLLSYIITTPTPSLQHNFYFNSHSIPTSQKMPWPFCKHIQPPLGCQAVPDIEHRSPSFPFEYGSCLLWISKAIRVIQCLNTRGKRWGRRVGRHSSLPPQRHGSQERNTEYLTFFLPVIMSQYT